MWFKIIIGKGCSPVIQSFLIPRDQIQFLDKRIRVFEELQSP